MSAEKAQVRDRIMAALRKPVDESDPEFAALSRASLRMAYEQHVEPYGLTPTTAADLSLPPGQPSDDQHHGHTAADTESEGA